MRIIDEVYFVGGAGCNLSGGCNVYMIDADGEFILVDIGHEGDVEYVKENITGEGMNPRDDAQGYRGGLPGEPGTLHTGRG